MSKKDLVDDQDTEQRIASLNSFQVTKLFADLEGTTCQLNHGMWEADSLQAVEWLMLPMGPTRNQDGTMRFIKEIDGHVAIPICEECARTLCMMDKDWVLLYCLSCGESHWICRSMSRLWYPKQQIVWQTCCKMCAQPGEKTGIFFADE